MNDMITRWTDKVDRECPLPEYPRPQLVRNDWLNLNGRYDFCITEAADDFPDSFDEEILVPFAVESKLSGICRTVNPEDNLWYRRYFTLDERFSGKRVILHFGGVDYSSAVYINRQLVGTHKGGYTPFSFDITDYLEPYKNEIIVQVSDPTETGWQDRGKQVRESTGFWYTATSGIWQTVWLEPVNEIHINKIKLTPDIDASTIRIESDFDGEATVRAIIKDVDTIIFAGEIGRDETVKINEEKLWSPENPFLYDVAIALCGENGEIYDAVTSYFGMRKFSVGYDDKAVPRLLLNNKPYFQNGLLDQGYWPDGGLTAPTDEAMIYDIQTLKDMGFNMLRKHIKVESHRWYYHCDKIGMIVWQDMVCGAEKIDTVLVGVLPNIGVRSIKDDNYARFGVEDAECRKEHENNVYATVDNLYNFPCIGCWVAFNEGWGQFDAKRIGEQLKKYDPTRIIDHASGWHDQKGPDVKSIHLYIYPFFLLKKHKRPVVLSEFGGYSRKIERHMWNKKKSFGYVMFSSKESLTKAYKRLYEKQIMPAIPKGLSACVYTQVSDVEFEVNGIFTYDREMIKLDENVIREINGKLKY